MDNDVDPSNSVIDVAVTASNLGMAVDRNFGALSMGNSSADDAPTSPCS